MSDRPQLSVVVPVFNEAGGAAALAREISQVLRNLHRPYEIIFVNDGSIDATLAELQSVRTDEPQLRLLDLDGNFGEAAALCAGFQAARGALVITLDGDGQNDPHDIPQLLKTLETTGAQVATGWRQQRQEAFAVRVLPSRIANWLIAKVTRLPVHDNGCGLKVYRRAVVAATQLPRGFNRFMPAIFGVSASQVVEVPVGDRRRQHGQSHYGMGRVVIVMRDLLALRFILWNAAAAERILWVLVILVSVVLAFSLVGSAHLLAALSFGIGILASLIQWNLRRWRQAQVAGVFRVRQDLS